MAAAQHASEPVIASAAKQSKAKSKDRELLRYARNDEH
jgi:hypothetical protein